MEDRLTQMSNIKVSEIMIRDPPYTYPKEKISTTELLMVRKNIGGLPVVKDRNNKHLLGIITQRDIRLARFAMNLNSPNTIVRDLMTPDPFTVKEDNTLLQVLKILIINGIQRLPVVNEENELKGLVIQNGILRTILQFFQK